MSKIKSTDSKEQILDKILSGKATIDNPYFKPLMELGDVIMFLRQHKQKVPKVLEDFEKDIHKRNLSWKPF